MGKDWNSNLAQHLKVEKNTEEQSQTEWNIYQQLLEILAHNCTKRNISIEDALSSKKNISYER
jgi:hypothetical protein